MTFNFDPKKEYILDASLNNQYTLYPINNPDIFKLAKVAMSAHWVAEEIDFTKDLNDWENKLTDNERFFIKNVLAFFSSSDGIVNENLLLNFYDEVKIAEARYFYANQIQMESIHSEVYSLMIDTYIKDAKEKNDLFNAISVNPIVKRKAEWCMKWMDPKKNTFPERLLAFGIIEGIFFSGSFCSIFWLKNRGLMSALCKSNKFIAKDESLHTSLCVLLYSKLTQKLPQSMVNEMFTDAINIEIEFITKSLPVDLIGMNSRKMIQYIKYVGDFWLSKLKYQKLYNVPNPFSWMESSAIESKSNMFETETDSYAKAGIGNNQEDNTLQFDLDI
jgi:ribonucleotide reductase beta subunit family protein with ferritin-like domain